MITKKVILDVDPGIEDAVAMALALFEPSLEVVAITATGGNVAPDQATRNVQAIMEQLDPPRLPRTGVATEPDDGRAIRRLNLCGADGLGNANFVVSPLQHRHPSEKVICDEVRAAPQQVTVLALGPLTNIARAIARDPGLPDALGQMIISGGTLHGFGNVTPAAEFNMYCDPAAARAVFRSPTTKTLIPLEISSQVTLTYDLMDQLPDESTRVGRLLRTLLPFSFRAHRQVLGLEGIHMHDAVALVAALHPELFEIEMTAVDIELTGDLTTGATVFDRRRLREWRSNIAVATAVDSAGVMDCIMRGLAAAGEASKL